jgi:hypothetical protein
MEGRHVGLDFYDLLIEALMRWTPTRCNWGSLASTRSRASRIFCLEGNPVRAAAPLWQDRPGRWRRIRAGRVVAGALCCPKHRSRRLSPRIGQNLAQTIADGEIFTCS